MKKKEPNIGSFFFTPPIAPQTQQPDKEINCPGSSHIIEFGLKIVIAIPKNFFKKTGL